ncbi:putative membrane protein [Pseudomonas duriflava]|uniref:Putative membrane protein n=1 Tax=Pseudomonas duriflava TaxID=459528 RepID=A0A562Q6U3_9PSED|nr:cytochrome c oxidase assembly protein [Pseudomonas duriflava]TWI52472.1 putative membrane protein [Pseudomonas duriflava]
MIYLEMPGHVPWLLVSATLVGWILYLSAYLHLQAQGRSWSPWRVSSFAGGIVLVLVALLPPVSTFAHADLRGHMLQHLLLGMFAPLGLVFGAPGTLLLKTLPSAQARGLVTFLGRPLPRRLTHPLTAAVLDMGGMYLLYLTPLYAASQNSPWLHTWLHLHFLVSGYLFTWSIAGPDPALHRPSLCTRLVVLFLATAAHAALAKLMYGFSYPRGLGLESIELQRAAQWMYYGGDMAEALLIVAFCSLWFRRRRKNTHMPLPALMKSLSTH